MFKIMVLLFITCNLFASENRVAFVNNSKTGIAKELPYHRDIIRSSNDTVFYVFDKEIYTIYF